MENQYHYDTAYNTLYVYDESQCAFVFACKNNHGLSETELINDYEVKLMLSRMEEI